jgi:sterol-4alpha-carboxylate 3-dehydrogenase (decarboxylating)
MSYPNIDERWPVAAKSSIYGESKVEAERIVIAANTTREQTDESAVDNPSEQSLHPRPQRPILTCVLRPSVIFGEGDKQLIPSIHACIAKGESRFVIGDGYNLWDTTYVGNVADAHVLALENLLGIRARRTAADADEKDAVGSARLGPESAAGETFFIQNNEPISFREFSLAVWKEFGHYPPSLEIRIPEGLGWALGLVAELFTRISGRPLTLSRGSVMDAAAMRYATGDKASRILGYRPRIGLEVGIRRSCQVSEVFFAGF